MCAMRSKSLTVPISCMTGRCCGKAPPPISSTTATCAGSISAKNSRYERALTMAVGQRLEVRQGQSLVMTPQLQQAIKLLQLSNMELTDYCEAELERNPLLERDEAAPRDTEREIVERESGAERLDESLAREDFSKVGELDPSAHENM